MDAAADAATAATAAWFAGGEELTVAVEKFKFEATS
jgi:hypothetical protein